MNRGFDLTKKFDKNTFKRLLKYMSLYKIQYSIVFICIIISSIVQVVSQIFLKDLIDDYIIPLTNVDSPIYTNLLKFIGMMIIVYIIGIIIWFYQSSSVIRIAVIKFYRSPYAILIITA